MATVNFSADQERPPLDRSLEEAGVEAEGLEKVIRVRLQPDLYLYGAQKYTTWAGLVWTVDCEDIEEGRRLREGLALFFKLFGAPGASQAKLLTTLRKLGGEK